jgi:hypothetical protein
MGLMLPHQEAAQKCHPADSKVSLPALLYSHECVCVCVCVCVGRSGMCMKDCILYLHQSQHSFQLHSSLPSCWVPEEVLPILSGVRIATGSSKVHWSLSCLECCLLRLVQIIWSIHDWNKVFRSQSCCFCGPCSWSVLRMIAGSKTARLIMAVQWIAREGVAQLTVPNSGLPGVREGSICCHSTVGTACCHMVLTIKT